MTTRKPHGDIEPPSLAPARASACAALLIRVAPVFLIGATAVGLALPATRSVTEWLLEENNPVELLTSAFMLLGGGAGLVLTVRARRRGSPTIHIGFYALYSLGLLWTGMEEIAWGQWFFHWKTPEAWAAINAQGETTLHNIGWMQHNTELMTLAFGVGGLVGLRLSRTRAWGALAPDPLLAPWFWVIAVHAACDQFFDVPSIVKALHARQIHSGLNRSSEMTEMLVAVAGWLYVERKLRSAAPPGVEGTVYTRRGGVGSGSEDGNPL